MVEMLEEIWTSVTQSTPGVLLALVILMAGWLLSRIVSKAVFVLLARTSLEEWASKRLGVRTGGRYGHRVERILAKTAQYALLLIVLVLVLNTLHVDTLNDPLVGLIGQIVMALPNVLSAVLIILVSYIIAKALSLGVLKLLETTNFDSRMGEFVGFTRREVTLSKTLSTVTFWFIIVMGVGQGLAALDLDILVQPLQSALTELVGILPELGAGVLILVAGILAARFVGRLVSDLLTEAGFNAFVARIGLAPARYLTIGPDDGDDAPIEAPDAAAAADADKAGGDDQEADEADEAGDGAAADEAGDGAAADEAGDGAAADEAGDGAVEVSDDDSDGKKDEEGDKDEGGVLAKQQMDRTPANIAGLIVALVITLLVAVETLDILRLDRLAGLFSSVIDFLPDLAIAFVIVSAGIFGGGWLRDRVDDLYETKNPRVKRVVGSTAWIGAIVFSGAIALQQVGVATDLILTAFAILFGAVCLTLSLAFGLGGREVAGQIVRSEYDRVLDAGNTRDTEAPKNTTKSKRTTAKQTTAGGKRASSTSKRTAGTRKRRATGSGAKKTKEAKDKSEDGE